MNLPLDVVKRFAPVVYLSRYEQYLPCSIEHLVQGARILTARPNRSSDEPPIIVPDGTSVWPVSNATFLASFREGRLPSFAPTPGAEDVTYMLQLDAAQYAGQPLADGKVVAPMYYAVQEFDDCIEITYMLLFAYQGGQTFRATRAGSPFYGIITKFGCHEGDLEEFVVRIVRDPTNVYRPIGVGYEAHGDLRWYAVGEYAAEGDHPVVHSALNGHSLHNADAEGYWVSEDYHADSVDFGSSLSTGIPWRPYEVANGLRQLGLDAAGNAINDQKWAEFGGRLGRFEEVGYEHATYLDHSGLNSPDQTWVNVDVGLAKSLNKIPDRFKHAIGPNGPAARPYIRPGQGYKFLAPLMVLHQGQHDCGELWFETCDGSAWGGAVKVPFCGISESPSPVVFRDQLHVFHQGGGDNGEMWHLTFDGVYSWQDRKIERVALSGSPSAVVFKDRLNVFHEGGGNSGALWHLSSADASTWSDVPLGAGLSDRPSAAVFKGRLHLFHQGGGGSGSLWTMSWDGSAWSRDQMVPNVALSGGPSAVVFKGRLLVFHQGGGGSGQLWCQTFDGTSWLAARQIQNVTMSGSPSAAVYLGRLWLFFQGGHGNGELWYMTSTDGTTWSAAQKRDYVGVSCSPAVIAWNTRRPVPDRIYEIVNLKSGLALDVNGGSMDGGASVIQWPWKAGDNQRWSFAYQSDGTYSIVAQHSHLALDVNGGSVANGATLIQWPDRKGDNQLWRVVPNDDGTLRLVSKKSGLVADVNGGSTDQGTGIIQWPWADGDNQKWIVLPA